MTALEPYINMFKRFADFKGRSTRRDYWMVLPFNFLAIVVALGLDYLTGANFVFYGIYGLAQLVPMLALSARRMHDIGKSGWAIFVSLIPIVGSVMYFIYLVTDSQVGPNAYGRNPKGILRVIYEYESDASKPAAPEPARTSAAPGAFASA